MITKSVITLGRVLTPTKYEKYYLMHIIEIAHCEFTHIEYYRTQRDVYTAFFDDFMTYEEKHNVKTTINDYIKRRK